VATPSFFIGDFMKNYFILQDLSDESLDAVLSLSPAQKSSYFEAMVKTFYPRIPENTQEFEEMVATYLSSFCVEKIYRSNRFFNEKFTPVYTGTGIIRNIVSDLYYSDDELITH
jgi:hypothetical protein